MRKRLITWFFYTILAGMLPLIFIIIICSITNREISFKVVESEIYFFNIILLANNLKDLSELKSEHDVKSIFMCMTIFMIIIVSACYGILLLNNYKSNLDLNLGLLIFSSKIITIMGVIISLCIQIWGGTIKNV